MRAFGQFVTSKSTFSCEFFREAPNLLPQNRCFVRGFCQISSHVTKCRAWNLHFATTSRSRGQYNSQKTRNKTRPKWCACREKYNTFSENVAKVSRLPRKTTYGMLPNMSKCHEVPCLPHETQRTLATHSGKAHIFTVKL